MKINEKQEAKLKRYIKNLVSESLQSLGSSYQFESDDDDNDSGKDVEKKPLKNPNGVSDQNNETEEEQQLRSSVEKFFKSTNKVGRTVDVAGYAYQLDGIKPKTGEDTNDMKNSRSLFMKKLNHEPNEQGYPYSFSTDEVNRLASLISSNEKMNESINRAVKHAIRNVIKESFDNIPNRDVHDDNDFDELDDNSKDERMDDPKYWNGKRTKKTKNRGVCAHFPGKEKSLEEIIARSVNKTISEWAKNNRK